METKKIFLVYRCKYETNGSTIMRCEQLAKIVNFYNKNNKVKCINEIQLKDIKNSIIVLSKSFLKTTTIEEISKIKKRNYIICADYIDQPERVDLDHFIDIYIASSISQYIFYKKKLRKITHLITHHTDPRIVSNEYKNNECNICYFGLLNNVKYQKELNNSIDFIEINDINHKFIVLQNYNVHYSVRNHRVNDGFKPFIKGFNAAICKANIIVPYNESDAKYYLNSDYPYILKNDSLKEIKEMIKYVKESYGLKEWKYGLEIMSNIRDRVRKDKVAKEFNDLINKI